MYSLPLDHTEPLHNSKRPRSTAQKWDIVARFCPLVGQLIMLLIALVQRNWMFVAMLGPGIIMTVAPLISTWAKEHEIHNYEDHNPQNQNATSDTDSSLTHFPLLKTSSTESLFWQNETPSYYSKNKNIYHSQQSSWQRITYMWMSQYSGLKTPLGLSENGIVNLDLIATGPHALVAGTTGSGKSVFLQNWCAGLAARYSPNQLNFIFLDFKGGATFSQLQNLPHVVGNVSDLNLSHAIRALKAIECELKRREILVAQEHVGTIDDLVTPPARIIIVVDEFHALRFALPDYCAHLVRIAAQGRSLGMHLILSTQNPLGQVSVDMKANIAINICLRVRDRMQSLEMINSDIATQISPQEAGSAALWNGEDLYLFRSANLTHPRSLTQDCYAAAKFCNIDPVQPLFSDPLPSTIEIPKSLQLTDNGIPIGLLDTGTLTQPYFLNIRNGNCAIIGRPDGGKTNLLLILAHYLKSYGTIRFSTINENKIVDKDCTTSTTNSATLPDFWLVDNADELLDPLNTNPEHEIFMKALKNQGTTVFFTLHSSKHLRYPEHCSYRIILPTGDSSVDIMSGLPSPFLKEWSAEEFDIPGRAGLLSPSGPLKIQCFLLSNNGDTLEK